MLFIPSQNYLGILLHETQSDDNDLSHVRKSMYAQENKLISHFIKCTVDFKVKLFNTYINSFYGIALWSQYKTVSRTKIVTAYKQVFRKLMHIVRPQWTSTRMVALLVDPLEVIERKMIDDFMNELIIVYIYTILSQLYINLSDMLFQV